MLFIDMQTKPWNSNTDFGKLLSSFFSKIVFKRDLISSIFLGIFVFALCLQGCGSRQVNQSTENIGAMNLNELKEMSKSHDRTMNSPSMGDNFFFNSLIDEFGDIPQVRTYVNLQQKIREKKHLTFDEIIALASAALYLYPSEAKAAGLKELEALKSQVGAEELAKAEKFYIWLDLTHGDSIEVHYPDGSKQVSGGPIDAPLR